MTDSRLPRLLDWRHAQTSDPARRCVLCSRYALLRNPDTDEPMHKVCAEAALQRKEAA